MLERCALNSDGVCKLCRIQIQQLHKFFKSLPHNKSGLFWCSLQMYQSFLIFAILICITLLYTTFVNTKHLSTVSRWELPITGQYTMLRLEFTLDNQCNVLIFKDIIRNAPFKQSDLREFAYKDIFSYSKGLCR